MGSIDDFKIKIFDRYLSDTGSTFEGFLIDKHLSKTDDPAIRKAKIQTIDEAIEIIGKDELFKNYLSEHDFALFKKL